MFKLKDKSNFTKFLAVLFLVLFVTSRGFSMLHAFSHQENGVNFKSENFFSKLIFSHEKSTEKNSDHCLICSSASLQSQTLSSSSLIFFAAFIYFVFALRKFDRIKLSYLLSSQAARAPPVIS